MTKKSIKSKIHNMIKSLLDKITGKSQHLVITEDEKVSPNSNNITEQEIINFSPCYNDEKSESENQI